MPEIDRVWIEVKTHRTSGLKMALSPDLPGFVVHANSGKQLIEKLPEALRSFMKITRGDDSEWIVSDDEFAPGFDPISYMASRAQSPSGLVLW